MSDIMPRDANIWFETLKLIMPVLTWVIACYAVTAIMDGESQLSEIMMASAYCLMPYILTIIPILSKMLCVEESGLYSVIMCALWIWIGILFIMSVYVLNGYSFKKTIFMTIVIILSMLLIWAIIVLIASIVSQFLNFIIEIIMETRMKI